MGQGWGPGPVSLAPLHVTDAWWRFVRRLKQIKMSEFDAELYERFSSGVRRQVTSFKVILDSLQVSGVLQRAAFSALLWCVCVCVCVCVCAGSFTEHPRAHGCYVLTSLLCLLALLDRDATRDTSSAKHTVAVPMSSL